MIDIRLKVFHCVARHLSFTRAAQELCISQPAISKHVRELEQEFKVRLFDRMGTRIALTAAGEMLQEHAGRILQEYALMESAMHQLHHHTCGSLRIGASTTIAQYIAPEMIARFARRFPDVEMSMFSGNSSQVEEALAEGRIDVGMVEGALCRPHLKYTPFLVDELVCIVRADHPKFTADTITLEQLKHTPLVLREIGSGTLDVIQQALARRGIRLSDLQVTMHLGTTEGIKQYVSHTDCMGIVSIRAVHREVYAGLYRIIDLEGVEMMRQLSVVEKQGATPQALEEFVRFIISGYRP